MRAKCRVLSWHFFPQALKMEDAGRQATPCAVLLAKVFCIMRKSAWKWPDISQYFFGRPSHRWKGPSQSCPYLLHLEYVLWAMVQADGDFPLVDMSAGNQ
jgi:hypothetical protein